MVDNLKSWSFFDSYESIFKLYNMPHKPVRIFTYLIGREISDLKAANEMACTNRGYFTHVTTLAEVKEQVLKYVPVMARPMVMYKNNHPVQWTGVYADVEVRTESREHGRGEVSMGCLRRSRTKDTFG